jgi:hypothetical protein
MNANHQLPAEHHPSVLVIKAMCPHFAVETATVDRYTADYRDPRSPQTNMYGEKQKKSLNLASPLLIDAAFWTDPLRILGEILG